MSERLGERWVGTVPRRWAWRSGLALTLIALATAPTWALSSVDCGPVVIKQLTHSSGPIKANNDLARPSRNASRVAYSNLISGGSGPTYRVDAASGASDYVGDSGNYPPYPSINDAGDKIVTTGEGDLASYYNLAAVYLTDFTQPPASRQRRIAGGKNYGNAAAGEISGDGNRIGVLSYLSNANGYAYGHSINLYDLAADRWFSVPGDLYLGSPAYSTLRPLIALNYDGSRVAFVAPTDPLGKNADGNFELFLYQVPGEGFSQITQSTGGDLQLQSAGRWPANSQMSINSSGTRLAFISNRDYTGENAAGDFEVFLYDTELQRFMQLSFGKGGDVITRSGDEVTYFSPAIASPSIDGSGDRVVFASRYNLLGTNPDQNWEIYLWDVSGATPRTAQITSSTDNPNAPYGAPANSDPWMSRDGNVIVFSSWSNLTGENAAGANEIFSATLCNTAPRCGDGKVDPGEECDNGADNSDTESNACRTNCTSPRCGDNVVDDGPPNLENCDDGNQVDGDDCPATCKLPMVLSPRLILGKGFCEDQPQKIELREGGTNRDITNAADVTYEWVNSWLEQTVLNAALTQVTDYLKSKTSVKVPDLKVATIEVVKDAGEVRFTAGDAGIGLNMIRAKRTTDQGDIYSNRALVISGLRLIQAGSLEIEPSSLANAVVDVVSEMLTKLFGQKMPNAPMILFSQGPFCNDTLTSIGRSGKVVVKNLKFDLFGGLIKDVDLLGGIEKGIGLIPGTQPLVKWAKAAGTAVAGELLDFEVSSEAAKSSEKDKKSAPVTSDAVIEVTDSFSVKFPFFHGVVTSKAPGISAVQATLDLGKCLGKASDNMFVWVTPSLDNQEVRNESGHLEDPLNVPLNGSRTAHAVGMLTAFRQGTQPITIPFDPIGMLTADIKKFIEKWVPGGKKIAKAANIPIDITYPRGASVAAGGLYPSGDNYFGLKFSYNPLTSSVTINDLRLQTAIPNLPVVTTWTMTGPPSPAPAVATVDQSAGVLTGIARGVGQVKADLCIPFFTNDVSSDFNGVRVLGDEMAVEATVFDDLNGDGVQDADEPGLGGWTVEVLNGNGAVITSGTTDAGGFFSVLVRQEQLPIGLNTFGLREAPQGGWTPTAPGASGYTGIPISLGAVVQGTFGNFQNVSVSGTAFWDENGDGIQDGTELGLPGWTIEFVDSYGAVHQATTGPGGAYSFDVAQGAFKGTAQPLVREVVQSGWTPTFPAGGSQDVITADDPLESGLALVVNFGNQAQTTPTVTPTVTASVTRTATATATTTVTPTRTATPTVSASPSPSPTPTKTPVAVIAGTKYHDYNGNGVRNVGEGAVADWVIFSDANADGVLNNPVSGNGACDANATELCTRTDRDGHYGFALTATGVYRIREVPRPGWHQTTAQPPDLAVSQAGQSFDGIDFGNQLELARRGTGDCNSDNAVTVDEILLEINIALGNRASSECPSADANRDSLVTVDEILKAVNYAVNGLPTPGVLATPTPTVTPTSGGSLAEAVGGRVVMVANGMSAFPSVITAL
ncbi:MAG: Cna domain protein, partial [Deltaproteobacteria bacterium]|nr:Cna domain protein [Deltaproteobacteria bacterium]